MMKFNVSFFRAIAVILGAVVLTTELFALSPALPIMQGATNESTTQISVIAPKKETLNFILKVVGKKSSKKTSLKPYRTQEFLFQNSKFKAYQLEFHGLSLEKKYNFQVLNQSGAVKDSRFLRALNTQKKSPKIVIASCMDDGLRKDQKILWKALFAKKPDVLFMIGDNIYITSKARRVMTKVVTGQIIWDRYIQSRYNTQLYFEKTLIPVLSMWDDNDYGMNDGDLNYQYRIISTQIFRAMYPQGEVKGFLQEGPGVSFNVRLFGQNYVLLDNRSFRTPHGSNKKETKQAHLGETQLQWLDSILATGRISWLIEGDQFFGAHQPWESFQGNHKKAFAKFLTRIKSAKSAVVFASGDRHLSEILAVKPEVLGYQTYEITSSPLHAGTYPGTLKKYKSKNFIVGVDGKLNFTLIKPVQSGKSLKISVDIIGRDGKTLVKKSLKVSK